MLGDIMKNVNTQYAECLKEIMTNGSEVNTRNSITKRIRNMTTVFDRTPLVSVRRTAWRNALLEMEWFLSGSSNINDLNPKVHHWWKPWADTNGQIKNNYSKQFRRFENKTEEVDQIEYLVEAIKNHPFSRRAVITTWNTADMISKETPITNCHGSLIQAFVEPDNSLHLTMYQRSADMLLGTSHNWIQYWALLMWLAKQSDRNVGTLTWIGGDCHIYKDHYDVVNEICSLSDLPDNPNLVYNGNQGDSFKAEDFWLDTKYTPLLDKSAKMVV